MIPLRSEVGLSLQASKWQKCPLLLDVDEMKHLLMHLGHFWIVPVSGLIENGKELYSLESFLDIYQQYIEALKRGEKEVNPKQRTYFSSVFTVHLEALYRVAVNDSQSLIKISKPVIQLQSHRFDYSLADHSFRSMVLGYDSIQWGIQFSYPHLYQDEKLNIMTVKEDDFFPNTTLFKSLQRWMRSYTIATPFEVQGKRINVPIRLGKKCLTWINQHPQLQSKGLKVAI